MIKVYINNGMLTVASGKKLITYPVGSGATNLGCKWDFEKPYALFADYNEAELTKFSKAELAKLTAINEFNLDSLAEFDSSRKAKLYITKTFNMSLEFNENALPCFNLTSAKELFALEILTAAALGKPLKICENCGEFFFPSGRSDSVYCDRISESGFACKKIGAHRQYRRNSKSNEIKKLYDKVTKHNRYLKSKGTLSTYEYNNWMKEASSKYADFKSGNLDSETFEAWLLGKEITPSPRTRARNTIQDFLL